MAWEQLKKFGQIECTILPDSIWSEKSTDRNTHTGGTNLVNYPNNTIIYQSDDIVIHKGPVDGFSGSNNSLYVRTRRSSSGWDAPVYVGSADNSYYGHSEVYVSAAIDKDNQIGALALTCHNNYSGQWNYGASSFDSINNFTNAIYLDLLNEYTKYAGGAGSGYIGNPLLSNKKMIGYNVPTSSSASTKTLSTDMYNSVATNDVPKEGNGYARIRYLQKYITLDNWIKDGWDYSSSNFIQKSAGYGTYNNTFSAVEKTSGKNLAKSNSLNDIFTYNSTDECLKTTHSGDIFSFYAMKLNNVYSNVSKITADMKIVGSGFGYVSMECAELVDSTIRETRYASGLNLNNVQSGEWVSIEITGTSGSDEVDGNTYYHLKDFTNVTFINFEISGSITAYLKNLTIHFG